MLISAVNSDYHILLLSRHNSLYKQLKFSYLCLDLKLKSDTQREEKYSNSLNSYETLNVFTGKKVKNSDRYKLM